MKYKCLIIPSLVVILFISGCTARLPNVLVKDNLINNGIPSGKDRIFWLSPDIWLDNNEDGNPDEFPVIGKPNKLFARIHNIGNANAENIRVKFYANKANTYFLFKEAFLIGTTIIPLIKPGESVVTSVIWNNVREAGFWSFGVAVESEKDLIVSDEPFEESNLAYRSFWNVYTYPGIPVILKFRVQNPFPTKSKIKLVLDSQKLPPDWHAYLGKISFDLLPKESKLALLMVTPPINVREKEGVINVISTMEGKIVGGVSYNIRVKE